MRSDHIQHEITQPSELLNKHGELIQKGYVTSLILKYQRKHVAKKLRLKEWDYYLIYNDDFAIALTVGKSIFLGLFSASFIDFRKAQEKTKSVIAFVPCGKLKMPESSNEGDIIYQNKKVNVSFKHENGSRKLNFAIKDFDGKSNFEAAIVLSKEPEDSMVIATPFKECKKDFYYNQKTIGMVASGTVFYNNKTYAFSKKNSFGLLDWGRGVWPHKVTWYWGAGQGIVDRKVFGFNLGYGFGDTSAATENMLFYNGVASKLQDVTFHIPKNEKNEYDYMKPWTVTSSDHRFEMVFVPIIDRSASLSAVVISTDQHQVFGKFTGKAILDDDNIIELHNFLGFMERVENKW